MNLLKGKKLKSLNFTTKEIMSSSISVQSGGEWVTIG